MARRVLTVVSLIVIAIVLLFSSFGSTSVCDLCGCTSKSVEFQLPLVFVTYWQNRKIQPTPLSDSAASLGFVRPHSHNWQLVYGAGNGVTCALGRGLELEQTVRSKEVSQFLICTNRFRGNDQARGWFDTALEYRKSKAVLDWLGRTGFPLHGFGTPGDYDNWRKRADPEWAECLQRNSEKWQGAPMPNKVLESTVE